MGSSTRGLITMLAVSGLCLGLASASAQESSGRASFVSQQKKTAKQKTKKGTAKPAAKPAEPAPDDATKPAPGGISFTRDIAPLLVANCTNCHNATHRSGLNQTTFEGLLKGGKTGKAIVAGKPDESLLLSRVRGEEGAKMPPGQNNLSPAAIEKIETWIKNGAILDSAGKGATNLADYAPTADQLRKQELAKLPASERDKKTEAVGLERLKQANAKSVAPVVQKGTNFLLFSNLPKERGTSLLKALDTQHPTVKRMLSAPGKPALAGPEKISLYVFKDRVSYVEFVRSVENQEVDDSESARAKLTVDSPYVIAVDPLGYGPEAPASASKSKKGGRTKKTSPLDELSAPDRGLNGLVAEAFTSAAAVQAGAPAWVSSGFGTLMASQLEPPRGRYFSKIRGDALDLCRIGWQAKATEALGGAGKGESTRAVGFALMEWISGNGGPQVTQSFIQTMLGGQAKLDDALKDCLGINREQFLTGSAEFVMQNYAGRGR